MTGAKMFRIATTLLAASLGCLGLTAIANGDESDYGPDWPVCRNLQLPPDVQIAACTRLLRSGKLTQQHTSWAYNNRGNAWMDLGKFDTAVDDLSKAIEIDPTNAAPHFNLAGILVDNGSFEAALKEIDRAVELNPAGGYLFTRRGYILRKMRRNDEALESYNKALAFDPMDEAAVLGRSIIYFYAGKFELSLADNTTLTELSPMQPEFWASRGQSYAALSEYDKAIVDFSKSIALAPQYTAAYIDRARSYFATKQYALSRADCETAIAQAPQYLECESYIARSLMLEGKFSEAIGKLNELIDVPGRAGPLDRPLNLLTRGVLKYTQGQYDAAKKDIQLSLDGDPKNAYAYLWKYLAQRRIGVDDKKILADQANHRDIWPWPVVRYISGDISAAEVLSAADVPNDALRKQRMGEANFYLAELSIMAGDVGAGNSYYRAALEIGEAEIPHELAGIFIFPLYKFDNDIEISAAMAALQGSSL